MRVQFPNLRTKPVMKYFLPLVFSWAATGAGRERGGDEARRRGGMMVS